MHDLIIFYSSQFPTIAGIMTSIRQRHGYETNLVQFREIKFTLIFHEIAIFTLRRRTCKSASQSSSEMSENADFSLVFKQNMFLLLAKCLFVFIRYRNSHGIDIFPVILRLLLEAVKKYLLLKPNRSKRNFKESFVFFSLSHLFLKFD